MIPSEESSDNRLSAIVRDRTRLVYEGGADLLTDRPAHVRAASGLARVRGDIALIQDDANFVALIDPATGHARAIPLPVGDDGVRQFHHERGNKREKLDLEACVAVDIDGDAALLAFGSGSLPRREVVVCVRFTDRPEDTSVRVIPLRSFYDTLRRKESFAGTELNVEAAVVVDGSLRLFSRGNGRASGTRSAINASCDVDLIGLLAHLDAPDRVPPPMPTNVVAYELGAIAGVRLGFTDAAAHNSETFYSATAESSPDAVEDGVVVGSAIGVIDSSGSPRWAVVAEPSGIPFAGKIEGILFPAEHRRQILAVIDMDDPAIPSELCTIELAGPWVR